MSPENLHQILRKFSVGYGHNDFYVRCPACGQDENRRKLHLSRGRNRVLVGFCFGCLTPGDKDAAFSYWKNVCDEVGVTADEFNELMAERTPDEVNAIWGSTRAKKSQPVPTKILHDVYNRYLELCDLEDSHSLWLDKRGLNSDWAFAAGYRTSPSNEDSTAIAAALNDDFGDDIGDVPGFRIDNDNGVQILNRLPAILTPVRDLDGKIFAIKHRILDNRGARNRWFSSTEYGGNGAVVGCHVPIGVSRNSSTVWVTEGERKADVAWVRGSKPTISIPGVGGYRFAISTLQKMQPSEVIVALDKDDAGNRYTPILATELSKIYDVKIATWEKVKGLDDIILSDGEISFRRSLLAPPHESSCRDSASRILRDSEIISYLQQTGPMLKSKIPAWQATITKFIREGKLQSRNTAKGLEVYIGDAQCR